MIRISKSSDHDEVADKEPLFTDMRYQFNWEQAVFGLMISSWIVHIKHVYMIYQMNAVANYYISI